MTIFFVSVEPTGSLWREGEGECESEDGVAVAVGGDAIADSSGDDEGCVFGRSVADRSDDDEWCVIGRSVLDRVKVDTRLDREELFGPSNWLTEQDGFK